MHDRKSYYYYFIAAVTDFVSLVGVNLTSSLALNLMSLLGRVLIAGDIKWSEIIRPPIFHLSFFWYSFFTCCFSFFTFQFPLMELDREEVQVYSKLSGIATWREGEMEEVAGWVLQCKLYPLHEWFNLLVYILERERHPVWTRGEWFASSVMLCLESRAVD